jgi:hypothetical protein
MHVNMMIADVGGIENVNGSRIATPLAPPRPGSTPMMTPSRMPMHISSTLKGVKTTHEPLHERQDFFHEGSLTCYGLPDLQSGPCLRRHSGKRLAGFLWYTVCLLARAGNTQFRSGCQIDRKLSPGN